MNQPANMPIVTNENSLLNSISTAAHETNPFKHWILSGLFTSETIKALQNIPFDSKDLVYKVGTREENNSFRNYFSVDNQNKYEAAKTVVDAFHSPSVLQAFTRLCGVNLSDHFLRIEYAQDQEGFWLGPHTDIGAKVFTLLIYLSDEPEEDMWGTDVYHSAEQYAKRIPFKENTALLFVPGDDTWHGFEPREMTGTRRALIVNFVKQEWRNRHELASKAPIKSYEK